jgi:hypothetical protein
MDRRFRAAAFTVSSMTRAALNRTLRNAYVVLSLVLIISFAAKLSDRIPGIAGTPWQQVASNTYDYLKDMSLVLITVVAAYLANVFQKRSKFIESLEEEWRGMVRTKSALYLYCEKPTPSADDYLSAFCRISETIDNMRIVYCNAGETESLVGLYPFAPLHDMRRALQSIDPRKRPDVTTEERKLVRDAILQSFYALRESFLEELDLDEPAHPLLISGGRRLKRPGATWGARARQERQRARQDGVSPPRPDIDTLLARLYDREQETLSRSDRDGQPHVQAVAT